MHTRLPSPLTVASAVTIALCLAASSGLAGSSTQLNEITVAEGEGTIPQPAPSGSEADPAGVLKPKTYPETPADVAECMKSWDPQTGMSKEEYEASCKRTLKYFPEQPD
jgi:hypothetical protein